MALRILTGILNPAASFLAAGSAVIHFRPHGVTGNAVGVNLTEWGDTGDYDKPPSVVVSLKGVRIADRNFFAPPPGLVDIELFTVTENPPTADEIQVNWSATNGAVLTAISYMVIGEA